MIVPTEQIHLWDAYAREMDAEVVDVSEGAVALDRTVFYATGGGQPCDLGEIDGIAVTDVRKDGDVVWHEPFDAAAFAPGRRVHGVIDWDRRHALMRTHTALHILSGVIWHEYGVAVTGGNMKELEARMDFEFDPLPVGFADRISARVNEEIRAERPVRVEFLPRSIALADGDLIRTKVNLIPESAREIRVVDIVGLDRQADAGTHVHSTGEVGMFEITKTESKGRGNKRLRVAIRDRADAGR